MLATVRLARAHLAGADGPVTSEIERRILEEPDGYVNLLQPLIELPGPPSSTCLGRREMLRLLRLVPARETRDSLARARAGRTSLEDACRAELHWRTAKIEPRLQSMGMDGDGATIPADTRRELLESVSLVERAIVLERSGSGLNLTPDDEWVVRLTSQPRRWPTRSDPPERPTHQSSVRLGLVLMVCAACPFPATDTPLWWLLHVLAAAGVALAGIVLSSWRGRPTWEDAADAAAALLVTLGATAAVNFLNLETLLQTVAIIKN